MTLQGVKQRFGIIGRSEILDRALSTAMRVSNTDLSVLIQGESGVGKEVFSKIIHELSKRKHNKFIAINCGAIPEGTINSELFGHEKGSFTGASSDRSGYFETVDGGTIFLDEIGEMPLDTQAYLLRVLESGEFIKVGSSKTIKTDVRVIAATNVGLEEQIQKGKFREDLYYRLNTVPIKVPALHERREDIYMLFRKFAVDFAEKYRAESVALDERAQLVIENYRWPGNVRELKNLVEQLSVLADQPLVDAEALLNIAPHLLKRNLPSVHSSSSSNNTDSGFQERELLFKFLLEMKTDLNDLKSLVYELINTNDLSVPDMQRLSKGDGSLDQYMREERAPQVQPNRKLV